MSKAPTVINIQTPSLEFPGRPGVTPKQNAMLQAEFFIMKAVERATWAYRHNYPLVVEAMNRLQAEIATEGIATEQGQDGLVTFMFEDAMRREFFKTIELNFFSMFGEWHNIWTDLVNNISYGLTYEPIGSEIDTGLIDVPAELYSRALGSSSVYNWLLANRWAVVLVMVKMWGVVPDAK